MAETTTILARCDEFPRRFNLTQCCVVWDLDEVAAWIEAHKPNELSLEIAQCCVGVTVFTVRGQTA